MRSRIACFALPVLLAATSAYGDSAPQTASSRSAGLSVEQKLQQPADIDLGSAETVTIGEVLDQIRERHGLRVQLYRGTAMLMSLCLDMSPGNAGNKPIEVHGGVVFSRSPARPSAYYLQDDVQYFPSASDTATVPAATSYSAPPTYAPAPTSGYVTGTGTSAQYTPASGYAPATTPANAPESNTPQYLAPTVSTPTSTAESIPATPVVPAPPTPEPVAPEPVTPEPATPESPAAESTETEESTDDEPVLPTLARSEREFRAYPVAATTLRGADLTVEGLLRAVIAQIPSPLDDEEFAALPVTYTHAYTWDLLIREEGVYVTTRAQANLHKVARVYRVPASGDFTPETLGEVVRRTIRPWSWRDQIDEVVNRIEIDIPPGAALPSITQLPTIDLASGSIVQTTSDGATPATQEKQDATANEPENAQASWLSIKAFGSLLSSGTIAAAHALINSLEMMHYADPPTATIEVLPGMLIISHSHSAHREIADLLEQIEAATGAE
ncbi:hypothetical protein Mal4_38220 [Maioricimonas rarisocia]|uniref:Secreted protein n=1 Tax=Maioricimonas rarisocia TaxID=2528026 RepID=A0A517ZAG4_9PLAN|nr:hypothetical protein [Maioricimonas rarisocia]QDU39477.1 hypothetical protein Mal4_38220 [Maioricimonas rarisocia]